MFFSAFDTIQCKTKEKTIYYGTRGIGNDIQ